MTYDAIYVYKTIFYYAWNNVHACTDTEKFNTYFKDLIC